MVSGVRTRNRGASLSAAERRQDRRLRLLEAALELFAANRFPSVTVDQVCQLASVSTKTFYGDFANKEDLFIELYDELIEQAKVAVLATDLTGLDEDGRTRARLSAFVHACVDDPRVARICFLEAPGLTPAIDARRRIVHHELAAYIESLAGPYIRARRRSPSESEPSGEDADRARRLVSTQPHGPVPRKATDSLELAGGYRLGAVAVVGAINEVIIDWVLDPDPAPVEAVIDGLAQFMALVRAPVTAGRERKPPDAQRS